MAVKKASSSSEKKLRATVKRLKAKLERADEKAARWKKKAKKSEAAAASSKARLSKLETKLAKARRATSLSGRHESQGADVPAVSPAESATSSIDPTNTPDASWTVAELRAEARSRGLTGLSRKSKAEMIAALT